MSCLIAESCVWSECAIDDTDDAYMGDNRDGDEQWYQYRTQNFCANAAYSLYGRKKGMGGIFNGGDCNRKHYINSYFTYGGADNLLGILGVTPEVYFGDNNDEGSNDGYSSSNAYCSNLDDYEPSASNEEDDAEEEQDQEDEERKLKRRLSEDNGGYSATMGCTASGYYEISVFESSSCDGNYYLETLDTLDSYNAEHAIGCRQIMKSDSGSVSVEAITQLLSNSWTCDVRMYPHACPDPFGQKANWEYAIRTAARGGNAVWAYRVRHSRDPLTNFIYMKASSN